MRMATLVMKSPLFSAMELMDSEIDVACVFCVAATLCERERVIATSAKIRKDTAVKQPSTPTLKDETTWLTAAAKMELLLARPAIDRERIVPVVCLVDNWSGLFCLAVLHDRWTIGKRQQPIALVGSQADNTLAYEVVEQIVSIAAKVHSSINVQLWRSCHELHQEADRLVKKAWSEASLHEEIETSQDCQPCCDTRVLLSLVTTTIAWGYCVEGVLDLFGGINTGLAVVLQ
ncbi:hypothetical protein AXG93_4101s1190 [Marchantia polymorpha subsp. ruderalis]|uniref:Uncharacterized protein n=1 Tax=Marchantia polymorpha subsp. ruderalis TaxID=1480154 RepID=A0A176VCQ0_MARPO|nr:hypothetical protein AXG93_4101s1190 [Marchantia polymorpha subsp. ruderalis]